MSIQSQPEDDTKEFIEFVTCLLSRNVILIFFNSLLYFSIIIYSGYGIIKALTICFLVFLCTLYGLGIRWILRGGFIILIFFIATLLDLTPSKNTVLQFASDVTVFIKNSAAAR